jgi:endonuclease/exonuclease/phosphatase family metal-dependent hydrolase
MPELKIATFNLEWMVSVFGGRWKDWDGTIPASFPGRKLGDLRLEPIEDVSALSGRIAGVIRETGAQIMAFQEGPPLKKQMEEFVRLHLGNDYKVHLSNPNWQTVGFLVHRSVADKASSFPLDDPEVKTLKGKAVYYPWGKYRKEDGKGHKLDRTPLVLRFEPSSGVELRIMVVHTKSKFSMLKTKQQWEQRVKAPVLDALNSRQKLSAEVAILRRFLSQQLGAAPDRAIVVMGDFNDGPLRDEMERDFLIHNILDELVGSFLEPDYYLKHAMTDKVLAEAYTTIFPDPFQDGKLAHELIDHVLVSPGIWRKTSAFSVKGGSCKVAVGAYGKHFADTGPTRKRHLRPSDHKPVCATLRF